MPPSPKPNTFASFLLHPERAITGETSRIVAPNSLDQCGTRLIGALPVAGLEECPLQSVLVDVDLVGVLFA